VICIYEGKDFSLGSIKLCMCWLEKHNEYVIDNLVPTYLCGNSTEILKKKIPKNLNMKYIETLKKFGYDVTLALGITSQKEKKRNDKAQRSII